MSDVTSQSQAIEIRQGNVGIGTTDPTQSLHIHNSIRINKALYDSNNVPGSNGQILVSTGIAVSWSTIGAGISGTISSPQIAFGQGNNALLGVSTLVYYGIGSVGIGTPNPQYHLDILGNAQVTGTIIVSGASAGFSGPGTNILNLNASNLFSGTVPSARVTGSYSGITSVGTLSALNVTGITSLSSTYLKGIVYDINASAGSIGQILVSTQSGVAWSSISAIGVATGTVGANQIAFGQGNNALLGVSTLVYYGIGSVGIGSATPSASLDVVGNIFSTGAIQANGSGGGFFGPGTNITNLDASQLFQGIVPSARVVGSYSGITSVGTLSALNVTGISSVGAIYLKGIVYDINASAGSIGQILVSTQSGVAWSSISAIGVATGTVGANQIAFGQGNNALLGVSTLVYYGIGSVGIGSATPSASLDVVGNIKATGAIILTGDANIYRSSANVLKTDGSLIVGSGITISSLTAASIPYIGAGGALTQDATNFTWDNTNKILMIGNVARKISDNTLILQSSTGTDPSAAYWGFNKNGSYGLLIGFSNGLNGLYGGIIRVVNSDALLFLTNNTAEAMRIDSAQNVGIGTPAPTVSLHIHNAMRLTGAFYDSANTQGNNGQILSTTGSATLWINVGTIAGTISDPAIAFGNANNNIIGVSTFVYYGIGSVGIGTATPTQFLHVNGAARLSGQLYDINNSPGAGGTGGVGGGLVLAPSVTGSGIAWTSTNVFTAVSNFRVATNGTTGIAVTTLRVTLPNAGTYKFEYTLLGIGSFISCGYKFGVNFTGTTATNGFAANLTYPSTGTTAATGIATGSIANSTGSIYESMATTTQSTTSPNLGPFTGINDIKRPIIYRIFGVLVATSGGDLDLYVACEQNLQYVGVDPGSVLEVRKF